MSAKGRGTEVQAADAYMTPPNLAQSCVAAAIATFPVQRLNRRTQFRILEPSAGVGAFVTPLRKHGHVTANEIDKRFSSRLVSAGASSVRIGSTETLRPGTQACNPNGDGFDLILGNPPYSLAAEHIDHLRPMLKPAGRMFFLLRINFLGSQKRAMFWERNSPSAMHVIRPRPYFLDAKGNRLLGKNGQPSSDSTEYALFEWAAVGCVGSAPFRFVEWSK